MLRMLSMFICIRLYEILTDVIQCDLRVCVGLVF